MRELAGKTAFVTGGASGIGFALGRSFPEAGMKGLLADIETDALAAALESLRGLGPDVRGISCDVALVHEAISGAHLPLGIRISESEWRLACRSSSSD